MNRACGLMVLSLGIARAAGGQDSVRTIKLPDDSPMAALKPGPGSDVTQANCAICHSTDYIVRQPGTDAAHWGAEVKKMVTVFGAPISDADAKTITDYLAAAYGPQSVTVPPRRRPSPRPRRVHRDGGK